LTYCREDLAGGVELLVAERAAIDVSIHRGFTPLFGASNLGYIKIVTKLLSHGARLLLGRQRVLLRLVFGNEGITFRITRRITTFSQ